MATTTRPSTVSSSRKRALKSFTVGTSRDPTASATGTSEPRTRARTATSTHAVSTGHDIVCAVTESRGVSPIVGLGFVNLSTAEVVLCQIVDNQSYVKTLHKLAVLEPTTIIVPETAVNPVKSKLFHALQPNLLLGVSLERAPRRYWDEDAGVDYIHQLAFEDEVETFKVSVTGSFFAVCCLSAALKFADKQLGITFSFHSMRMRFEPSEGSMMIDLQTIRSLELIQNIQDSHSKHCLFGLLNSTGSPMGARLLKGNLLQPLIDKQKLEKRYDAVDDLLGHMDVFTAVREALKGYPDIDKVLTEIVVIPSREAISYWEQSINNILLLKQCLRSVPPLFEALAGVRSELLQQIRQLLEPNAYGEIAQLIDGSINDDVTFQKKPVDLRNQRTYAVKSGVNGLLDVARQTYSEASRDAQTLMEELSTTHNLHIELKYDTNRLYFLFVPSPELEERCLPDVFVNAVRRKHVIECSTLDLVKLNQRIVDSHHEVLQMSEPMVLELVDRIRESIAPLFRISDGIALLDLLTAFADAASKHDYCRPELTPALAIKHGRHPIHERIHRDKFIPNDVFANAKLSRVQIITGCNMSGKSTYIRSIALITVMAQAGGFVPATYASIPIRHQLFARLSIDDSSTSSISTFAEEMRETAFILRNIDARALVIIDELGRGTSTRDGLAIAIAVVEALLQARAFVWFVTHFHDLAVFMAERPGLVNRHLQVDIQDRHISMLYRIAEGLTPPANHGLVLASAVGLPPTILEAATRVSDAITRASVRSAHASPAVLQARRAKLLFGLKQQLLQARDGRLEGRDLAIWLERLQEEFVRRMTALDEGERSVADTTSTSASNLGPGSSDTSFGYDDQGSTCAGRSYSPLQARGQSPDPKGPYQMAGAL